jgi:hypothetical protein
MRKLWRILLLLVVIAGASAAVYAWTRSGKKNANGLKEVDVTTGSIYVRMVDLHDRDFRAADLLGSRANGSARWVSCPAMASDHHSRHTARSNCRLSPG